MKKHKPLGLNQYSEDVREEKKSLGSSNEIETNHEKLVLEKNLEIIYLERKLADMEKKNRKIDGEGGDGTKKRYGRRQYKENSLEYMLTVAQPEIIELLANPEPINPVYFIKNYLRSLSKVFRGKIQTDLGWRAADWDAKIARIVKYEAEYRLLSKAEKSEIELNIQATISDFDNVCKKLGFATTVTSEVQAIYNEKFELYYQSLYGAYPDDCQPNMLRILYDFIKNTSVIFISYVTEFTGMGDAFFYKRAKYLKLIINDAALFSAQEIEVIRLSFLYVKALFILLVEKVESYDYTFLKNK